jgi:hypothetical protein
MAELVSTLADVSTMWFVCWSFLLCLIPLAIVGAIAFGMYKLLRALPPVFEKGQEGMAQVAAGADQASKRVAAPFIAASAFASQVRGMLRSLSHTIRRNA